MIRRTLQRSIMVAALAAAILAASPKLAFAYIDPGTGGMLLQLLLGGVAGSIVIIKLYWHRLREATARLFRGRADPPQTDGD